MNRRRHRAPTFRPRAEVLDDRLLLSGLTPSQLTHAYGLDALTFANGAMKADGSGETIALVEAYHDPYLPSDLKTFDAANGLPDPNLSVVNLGGSQANDGWASEAMLDVEWAHSVAPGAKILVVEASSEGVSDLMAAVNVARNAPGVAVVSMSWGFSEFPGELMNDSTFTTPAGHQGVTFFTASGDTGLAGGTEWPSSSPNVVSVGGTTLNLGASGTIAGESVWANGGGGVSAYEAEPAYQKPFQATGMRTTPDVTFDADPATGAVVYSTVPSTGQGLWQTIGGTSLGTPAWAAIVAIADQGLALAGKSSLDGVTQTLPTLYALSSGNWGDFNAVSSTPVITGGGGRYHPLDPFGGYLTATSASSSPIVTTGLGSPNGLKIVTDLSATPLASNVLGIIPSTGRQVAPPANPAATTPTQAPATKGKKHKAVPRKKPRIAVHKKAVAHAVHDAAIAEFGAI